MTSRALTHPRLKCSPEVARALGAKPRKIGQGWPQGTILIAADDGSFWLWRIETGVFPLEAA